MSNARFNAPAVAPNRSKLEEIRARVCCQVLHMKLWHNGGFKAPIGDHLTALARAQREKKDES
jgi:hypothetical protein